MISSKVIIPASIEYIEAIIGFFLPLAEIYGINKEESQKMCLALEEIVVFIIQNLFPKPNSDTIEITFEPSSTNISIIIHHFGIPLDPGFIPVYSPQSIDNIEEIGLYMAKKMIDEITFNNLGKKGKEWRLTKNFETKRIDKLIVPETINSVRESQQERPENAPIVIQEFTPDFALEISKGVYYCYDYSYDDYFYYPEKIIALNNEGILRSIVVVTDTGDLVGHGALRFNAKDDVIAELSGGFVKPSYRNQGILGKITERLVANGRNLSLMGVYSTAVTSHPISQKDLINSGGFIPTGILLGGWSTDLVFNAITGKTTQKESLAVVFKPLHISSEKRLYLPDRYRGMILTIYDKLGIPVLTGAGSHSTDFSHGSTDQDMTCTWDKGSNVAYIRVIRYSDTSTSDLKTQFRSYCLEHVDVILCYLNLEDPETPSFTEICNDIGFFFAGILPGGLSGCDALILQFLNNLKIDTDRIKLYSPFSQEILSFIQKDMP